MHRLLVASLALVSLVLAWALLADISRTDPWYRNTDMNIYNMVDALSMNADVAPHPTAHPGLPLKLLLAADYRVRHYLGLLPVWNIKKFGASRDPLQEIPPLIRLGRLHSRILVLLLILAAAGLAYAVTREVNTACFTVILLCGSPGLLFHGLLTRPELLCVGLGNVLALLCTWQATETRSWFRHHLWLFLAGVFCGLAALEKVPGIWYLVVCHAWCWLAAVTTRPAGPEASPAPVRRNFWGGLLPVASAGAVLWLLLQLSPLQDTLGPVVILRLRLAAVLVGVLPLLALLNGSNRLQFLLARGYELALLGGGALAALPLAYLSLRGVLSEAHALDYLAGILPFVINPAPLLSGLRATGLEFSVFFRETPFLFLGATGLALGVCAVRTVPARLRAFLVLLLANGLGMTLLMCKWGFADHISLMPQLPLLLVWSLGLFALGVWQRQPSPTGGGHWAAPLLLAAALVLLLTVPLRLEPKYTSYQSDAGLPVNNLTLTFLFDHDAHTNAYLQIMKDHYGNRDQFATVLDRYLADPAHRY